MAIEKLSEFAKDGQKNTDDLNLTDGFSVSKKPARQWFNWLFNTLTLKINEIIEADYIRRNEIVDNLTTDDATKPVSAKQAKKLQDEKLAIADLVNNLTSGGEDKALTAEQGKILLSMFACSQNTSGYQKIPNPANPDKPLIIQWGLTPYSSPTSAVAVTLPIRFPNEIFNILLTVWDDGLGAFATINNKTLSGFDYSVWITRNTRSNVEIFSYYIAIGC